MATAARAAHDRCMGEANAGQRKESEYPIMNTTQKVAIVTGASQGIGAALVAAYRKLGYAVVANSRSITASGDPGILTVPGDLANRVPAPASPSRPWRGSAGSTP